MNIIIRCEASVATQYRSVAQKIINQAAKAIRCPSRATLTVSFIGDAKIRLLNRQYRGKDRTTNVLSFSTHDSSFMIPASQNDLGDILISFPAAKREAKEYGWTLKYEIARLALHGFLHLLGYDHEIEKEARKMEGLEQKILKDYGQH